MNKSILAGASLVGTIIGAGIFGLPFAVSQSGVLTALFYFVLLSFVVLALHLFYGEVVLRTEGRHQFTGYVKKYLGNKPKKAMLFATILGSVGALLVYVILAGEFFNTIFPNILPLFNWSLFFCLFLAFFVFLDIKSIALLELLMGLALFAVFFLLFIFCLPKINAANYTFFNAKQFFLPFGILLFSLVGWHAIPEIMDIIDNKQHLKKIISVSFLLCVFIYLLFAFLIAGVSGVLTTEHVFEGLRSFLGNKIIILGSAIGILAVATSFLLTANYLKHTLKYDCRLPGSIAFGLTIFAPLLLFIIGFRQFALVVGVVGSFMGLAEGAAIALIYQKAKTRGERIPEYSLKFGKPAVYFIIAILFFGALADFIGYFR